MVNKVRRGHKNSKIILLIIVLFIYSDILCENFLVIVNNKLSGLYSIVLVFTLLVLQIVFAPLQSGFSDFYGRRKSLILSLSVSFLSLLLAYFYLNNIIFLLLVIILSNFIKGAWGNTIPISFAAIADTQSRDYRGSFAIASGVYSLAFITFISIRRFPVSDNVLGYVVGGILLASLIVCIRVFRDPDDATAHLPLKKAEEEKREILNRIFQISKKEISLIRNEMSRSLTKRGLVSYLLWETSMYSILVSEVDFYRGRGHNFALYMMIGYLFGVAFLRIKSIRKLTDGNILTIGYLISFLSLFPYFLLYLTFGNANTLLSICYFFHAFGNALLSPTIITILAKGRSSHDQGKILGLVESADTVSFLFSTVIVMVMIYLKVPLFFLILASFISFSVSWIFYKGLIVNSKKMERKN